MLYQLSYPVTPLFICTNWVILSLHCSSVPTELSCHPIVHQVPTELSCHSIVHLYQLSYPVTPLFICTNWVILLPHCSSVPTELSCYSIVHCVYQFVWSTPYFCLFWVRLDSGNTPNSPFTNHLTCFFFLLIHPKPAWVEWYSPSPPPSKIGCIKT